MNVGWIGTGVMGRSMCGHLLRAGHSVVVFNRTRAKAAELEQAGATWADSPREVARQCDVAFTIVGFPEDVRAVYLAEDGLLAGCQPDQVLVDMTTSRPALAEEIAEKAALQGVATLDAPVSGGDTGAREARLSIMVGGEAETLARVKPLLDCLGATIVHQGGAGCGQHTKMVNQILIATNMIGVCEGLLYAVRSGLDPQTVLASVASGAAGSWSLSHLGPRMIEGDFAPGFFVEHFIKDMGIALDESRRLGLELPGLALAESLYQRLQASGGGRQGTQGLYQWLAETATSSPSGSDRIG